MSYPPAPWRLVGRALQTTQLVDIDRVHSVVPAELDIIPILPGKTLAAVYAAYYGPGSVLQYHELIVAPALVHRGRAIGFWISDIYVDNEDSMTGGREIWGLPKEMAQFAWQEGEESRVVIRQGDRPLCTFSYGPQRWLWRMPLFMPVLSALAGDLMSFRANVSSRFSLAGISLDVPGDSPLAELGLGQRGLPYHSSDMVLNVNGPQRIGRFALSGTFPEQVIP